MKRFRIFHQTDYHFSGVVRLHPHTLRLRPREGHELRIESSVLDISPSASVRWHRDVEGNSVAVASFNDCACCLAVKSEIIIQQYDQTPLDFLVADYALDYPFYYTDEEKALLAPYMAPSGSVASEPLKQWVSCIWQAGEPIQTFALLLRLTQYIHGSLTYQRREEEGVQTAEQTLLRGAGSCRDYASLLISATRSLGFAARFVSGYSYNAACATPFSPPGSTHAWAEVFIPGAGWKGFDPTTGSIVGADHIAVAVARLPESVPPVAGSFHGLPGANMTVNVRVTSI